MTRNTVLVEVRRQPEEHSLRLTWSDGHVLEHPYDFLRGWCPCAMCQGHDAAAFRFHAPPKPVKPETIEPVGNYAISIVWSDGHGTGIYRYDYLRELGQMEPSARSLDRRTRS